MVNAFISYSHFDARVLERLHVHLAMLNREGLISAWDDRKIEAGGEIDRRVQEAHGSSLLFLPIVSPDFLASNYCYDKEMELAISKAEHGDMVIIPIIAQPCDWLASPLSRFKAVPKDGKPISEWTNENNAYLDIVKELRRALTNMSGTSAKAVIRTEEPTASPKRPNLRIKRTFTSIDRDNFRNRSFEEIRSYFQNSAEELSGIEEIQFRLDEMSQNAFTCTLVNRTRSNAESHITIHNKRGGRGLGDITCSYQAYAADNTANEMISVEADDFTMFLTFSMRGFGREPEQKLSAFQVADILWKDFVGRAGISYD